MHSFKALNTRKYLGSEQTVTSDTMYWKKLSPPVLVKEYHAIDYIDFSSVEPYYFAVTCSLRVQIYNPVTKLVVKNLSRFQENAYGGSFRHDGGLLVAGDGEGLVKIFNTKTREMLRVFRGHTAAVHRAYFPKNTANIVSFSDDKTVKLWDVKLEALVHTFAEHQDYIRAGCVSPASPYIILSGGYDNLVKMYDTRTNTVPFSVNHGSPVESVLFLPSGGIFLSAGSTEICIWDAFRGGRLLGKLTQHNKTVTSLRLASNGKRILSGSLDRQIKVYDVSTYKTVHTFHFASPVLSIGVARNDKTVVAGMVDGILSIRDMHSDGKEEVVEKPKTRSIATDLLILEYVPRKGAKYDDWLRKYEYAKALDEVLKPYVTNKQPNVTVSVMQELIRRKGLHRALTARSNKVLSVIVKFIIRYIGEHRFTNILTSVANILLDVYEDTFYTFTGGIGNLFIKLLATLKEEVELTYKLLELQGTIELLISGASASEDLDEMHRFINEDTIKMNQSINAKKIPIISVS